MTIQPPTPGAPPLTSLQMIQRDIDGILESISLNRMALLKAGIDPAEAAAIRENTELLTEELRVLLNRKHEEQAA